MSNHLPEMEQRILDAAIQCVEKFGLQDATVRRIAEKAGVNGAAINYYFRSKEQLIDRVMAVTLENAFDWSHFDSSQDFAPRARLAAILEHIIAGAQAFPAITRAHFHGPLSGKPDAAVTERFNGFLERVCADLEVRGARPDGQALRFAVLQAFSSLFTVGMLPEMFSTLVGQPLTDATVRKAYIDSLVDSVLPPP